jgi:hypothetical protein
MVGTPVWVFGAEMIPTSVYLQGNRRHPARASSPVSMKKKKKQIDVTHTLSLPEFLVSRGCFALCILLNGY